MMNNNKGFSLVELLVAMAVAAIVAGGISYLLVSSMRMYGNEVTDVALQQELQSTLNLIMDYAAETQTLVVRHRNDSDKTLEYFMIGSQDYANPTVMNCQIFFKRNDKLYMVKGRINDYNRHTSYYSDKNAGYPNPHVSNDWERKNLQDIMEKIRDDACGTDADPKLDDEIKMYLLADFVDKFDVIVNGDYSGVWGAGNNNYKNPISFEIHLKFSKQSGSKKISKEVTDKVAVRNTLKTTLVIDGTPYFNPIYEKPWGEQKDLSID